MMDVKQMSELRICKGAALKVNHKYNLQIVLNILVYVNRFLVQLSTH